MKDEMNGNLKNLKDLKGLKDIKDLKDLKSQYSTAATDVMPEALNLALQKESSLRYGENPGQDGALYAFAGSKTAGSFEMELVKSGKGGPSATNIMDLLRAVDILKFFKKPACAVMKHCIPSGFAVENSSESLADIYKSARDADARSAFGSVVVFNCKVDKETAAEIMTTYVEQVGAIGFDEEALELFNGKKNLRVVKFSGLDRIPKYKGDETEGIFDMKVLAGSRVIAQKPYLTGIRSADDLVVNPTVEGKQGIETANSQEMKDLLTAWHVNIGVRSNGVVIVKDGVTLAVGSGKQERVRAVADAITTAYQKAMSRQGLEVDELSGAYGREKLSKNPLKGAVLSSDGFIPFADTIKLCADCGISAIVQPGGSVRDAEVIEAANEHGIAMVLSKERCFGHF